MENFKKEKVTARKLMSRLAALALAAALVLGLVGCDTSSALPGGSADLIPNLVNTVKGYASHESEVFTQVTAARAGVVAAASPPSTTTAQRAAAENQLYRALFKLQATPQAYPQQQPKQNFMDLQNQLKELENKIAYARQFYNDVVLKLNTAIETVPTNIIAGLFHFEQAQYFEADDASRQVPQVQF